MAYTLKERFANKKKIKQMPLVEIKKKYGQKDLLQEEINRRLSTNKEEVMVYYRDFSPRNSELKNNEVSYSKFIDYVAKILNISPLEILTWDRIENINNYDANLYLTKDLSWINNEKIISKVSSKFLLNLFMNLQDHNYASIILPYIEKPDILDLLSGDQIKDKIDYSKSLNIKDLLLKLDYSELKQYCGNIIIKALKNKNYNVINDIMHIDTNLIKEYFYAKGHNQFLYKLKSEFNIDEILELLNYVPIDIIQNKDVGELLKYLIDFNKDAFNNLELLIELSEKILNQKFALNLNFDYLLSLMENIYSCNQEKFYEIVNNNSTNLIYQKIIQKMLIKNAIYIGTIPENFKENYNDLFFTQEAPQELKDKFFNGTLNYQDFNNNPNWYDYIKGDVSITFGLENMQWLSSKVNIPTSLEEKKYIVKISEIIKNLDKTQKAIFENFVLQKYDYKKIFQLENIVIILKRLNSSNSSEIRRIANELTDQLLQFDNPLIALDKVENIFLRNNLPYVGKLYKVFNTLHPTLNNFLKGSQKVSPMLKGNSDRRNEILIFSDLIKAAFGSNNRSVLEYLKNLEIGNQIFEQICKGTIKYEELESSEKVIINSYARHLSTLYANTLKGKDSDLNLSDSDVLDIQKLKELFSVNGQVEYNLPDRIIKMFCHFAGIDTLEEAKAYIQFKINAAQKRNEEASKKDLEFKKGDFIKGIGDIKYLKNILQNGSLAKEFLGADAGSDLTPLDTDLSMILNDYDNIGDAIEGSISKTYGPIWFILKNDERFITTRDKDGEKNLRDTTKLEVFRTLNDGHYGIRTGFASSEIDYIVVQDYKPEIGLEIAINGFYIPVYNRDGKILFTIDNYNDIRNKMQGLSYYDINDYSLSSNLAVPSIENIPGTDDLLKIINASKNDIINKKNKIYAKLKEVLESVGLNLKIDFDGNLEEGYAEVIDTGSTGRETNIPDAGDFDFILRLDRNFKSDNQKMEALRKKIEEVFFAKEPAFNGGNVRFKGVQFDDINIDLDISFVEKTDKLEYSTDKALKDRLDTIKRMYPQKYDEVIANIIIAKMLLKEAQVYKPCHANPPQNGLGGVGIENWILQNNGSLMQAINNFLDNAEGKTFEDFKKSYFIWDFGENHYAFKENGYTYPHDNFVADNMKEDGYKKMIEALRVYRDKIITHDKTNQEYIYQINQIIADLKIALDKGEINTNAYSKALEKLKSELQNRGLYNRVSQIDDLLNNINLEHSWDDSNLKRGKINILYCFLGLIAIVILGIIIAYKLYK